MSEFRKKLALRAIRNSRMELQPFTSLAKLEESYITDPRKKYPVRFDLETKKLSIHDIEIIVADNESALKCSLCDFSIIDEKREKTKFGAGRTIESIIQDHIIGIHIGKCSDNFNIHNYYSLSAA